MPSCYYLPRVQHLKPVSSLYSHDCMKVVTAPVVAAKVTGILICLAQPAVWQRMLIAEMPL